MTRITNVYSNNFFAEMLVKALGAARGRVGSTEAGTRVVKSFAASLGATVYPVDGSGLTFSNRGTAWGLAGLLPLLTGTLGWCPAYTLFGISTCPVRN